MGRIFGDEVRSKGVQGWEKWRGERRAAKADRWGGNFRRLRGRLGAHLRRKTSLAKGYKGRGIPRQADRLERGGL